MSTTLNEDPQSAPVHSTGSEPTELLELSSPTVTAAASSRFGSQIIGAAKSTIDAYETALKIFDWWAKHFLQGSSFSIMTDKTVENENLQQIVTKYATFLCCNRIPKHLNMDRASLESTHNETKFLTPLVLLKYFGKVKEAFSRKFPKHDAWSDTGWYQTLTSNLKSDLERSRIGTGPTMGTGGQRPLYRMNSDKMLNPYGTGEPIPSNWLAAVDLCGIISAMINKCHISKKSAHLMRDRAKIVLSRQAASRAGEIKFLQYSEWEFDFHFHALKIVWSEMKDVKMYAMAIVADKNCPELCPYHALGCFWAFENGLARASETDSVVSDHVFPDLHEVKNEAVARQLRTIIQKHLPPLPAGADPKIKNDFSAKSLRYGAITEMSVHPQIGLYESTARSGHSTGTNQDSYMDKNLIARTLPGGRCLAGWDSVFSPVGKPPRLECIGRACSEDIERFLDKLFHISINAFLPKQSLRSVLENCAASLIMWHPQMTQKYTRSNVIVHMLVAAATESKISDPTCKFTEPNQILCHWSEKIYSDFKTRNGMDVPFDARDAQMAVVHSVDLLRQQVASLQECTTNLVQTVNGISQEKTSTDAKFDQILSGFRHFNSPSSKTKRKLDALTSLVRTPELDVPSFKSHRLANGESDSPLPRRLESSLATLSARSDVSTAQTTSLRSVNDVLVCTSRKETTNNQNQKHPSLHRFLCDKWLSDKSFRARLFTNSHPFFFRDYQPEITEKNKLAKTMDLLDASVKPIELAIIRNKDSSKQLIHDTFNAIVNSSLSKLSKWEGTTDINKKKSHQKSTYISLGARVVHVLTKHLAKTCKELDGKLT